MIDTKLLAKYTREKSFIGNDYTSGYNFDDKYYVKYDTELKQYYIFPAGRVLNRIYVFPMGQRINNIREIVGLMLAYSDPKIPEATRAEFFNKLPNKLQEYIKAEEDERRQQAEQNITAVNTDIKMADKFENVHHQEEQEKPKAEPSKNKGGRPRTREVTGRKYVHLWINETEHEAIKQLLATMRNKK